MNNLISRGSATGAMPYWALAGIYSTNGTLRGSEEQRHSDDALDVVEQADQLLTGNIAERPSLT